jgi:hypothetical protein
LPARRERQEPIATVQAALAAFTLRARPQIFHRAVRALLDLADRKEWSCQVVDAIAREHPADVKRTLADRAAKLDSLIGQRRHGMAGESRILESLTKRSQPRTQEM